MAANLIEPRIHIVADETPVEHLRNAQQLLRSFAFLNDEQRAGADGLDIIYATARRVATAVSMLEWEASHPR